MSVEPAVDGEVWHVRTVAGGLQGYKQPGPGSLLPHADLGSLEQFGGGSGLLAGEDEAVVGDGVGEDECRSAPARPLGLAVASTEALGV